VKSIQRVTQDLPYVTAAFSHAEDASGVSFVIGELTFATPDRCLDWASSPARRASSPEYLETANKSDKIPLTALSWTESDSALLAILHILLAAQPECPASTPTA
jgi:hypothetical protein